MMVVGNNCINKEDFLHLYPSVFEVVFISRNIYDSFIEAGLKLLDKDYVPKKITYHLHILLFPLCLCSTKAIHSVL